MSTQDQAIRFGVHSGQQYPTVDEYLDLWQRSEDLGYDWVSDFDHFRPPQGGLNSPCFEGTTLLAAMAARTRRVRCGVLVLGVTYRHPAIVAAIAATIDHISGGRLELGVGATADDLGQTQFGLVFPRIGVRLEMLDEACRILRSLWSRETTSFDGRHYVIRDGRLEPKPLQHHLPLVIGGGGGRRLLRIVAQHADIWNTAAGDIDAYRHSLDVLVDICRETGRNYSEIRKSVLYRAVLAESESEAKDRLDEALGGVVAPDVRARFLTVGTAEQCVEDLRAYRNLGVNDFILGVRPPVDWQTVELVAEQVAPSLRGS